MRSVFLRRENNPRIGLANCERDVSCLLRLPLFCELRLGQARYIARAVKEFYAA